MDADLETIGARCHFCSRQDFLPFTCSSCTLDFCLAHAARDQHECDAPTTTTTSTPTPSASRVTASTTGPSLKQLQASHLARQTLSQQQQQPLRGHQQAIGSAAAATAAATTSARSSTLQALRNAIKARTYGSSSQKRSSSGVVQASMALGRMKALAKGDAGVPPERRHYLSVTSAARPEKSLVMWVDATWTVGKTLDVGAAKLGLQNDNARTLDEGARLHVLVGDMVLEPSQIIGQRCANGAAVVLFKGTRPV